MSPPRSSNATPANGKPSGVSPEIGLVWEAAPSCPRLPTRSLAVYWKVPDAVLPIQSVTVAELTVLEPMTRNASEPTLLPSVLGLETTGAPIMKSS